MRDKLIKILQDMGRVAFTNKEKADYLLQHDVVPVVRCKNCKQARIDDIFAIKKWCWKHYNSIKDDDGFCSYGERKE